MRRFATISISLIICLSLRLSAQQNWMGYRIDSVAGGSINGDGGPATSALLVQAQGLAFDSQHRLYIADAIDHKVRRINAIGTIETIAGTGVAGFSGDGGPARDAQLQNPYGIAIDASDNLYIADLGNSRVRLVTVAGRISTYAGGGLTAPGGSNDGKTATQYVMGSPRNLALDSAGLLYISDFGRNQVYQVTRDGHLATFAGTGQAGYDGDFGPAALARLNAPAGLTFLGDGSLVICDSGNKVIRRVLNQTVQTFLPSDVLKMTLSSPTALAFLPSGFLLVGDPGAGVVFSVNIQTGAVTNLPGATDIAIDANQNLYLAQQGFVTELTGGDQQITIAGSSNTGFYGENVPAKNARLNQPTGVAADGRGNIFIADRQGNRIRRVDANGIISTFAGTGTPGYSGDGGLANRAQLNRPSSVSFDIFGNLLIADTGNNAVRTISPVGTIWTIAGTGTPGQAVDDAVASASALNTPEFVLASGQTIYISDTGNHSVRIVDPQGRIHRVAGSDKPGNAGDGQLATGALLGEPRALAMDTNGQLYIADEAAGTVRRVNAWGIIDTVTGPATGPWVSPAGLTVLTDGTLWISDFGTQQIRALHPDGAVEVVAGTGIGGFSGDQDFALSAQLNSPTSLFVQPDGTVLVTDTANNRVRQLSLRPPAFVRNSPMVLVVNDASRFQQTVSPGEIVDITGAVYAAKDAHKADLKAQLPLALGGSVVLINGRPAPLLLAGKGQIELQIPYELAGSHMALVQVLYNNALTTTSTVSIADSSPGLYLWRSRSQVFANLENGTLNNSFNPAPAGSTLSVFVTGAGLTTGSNITGAPVTLSSPPALPVTGMLGSEAVQIVSTGEVVGGEGLFEIKFVVPRDMATGKHAFTVKIGDARTQHGLILWVQSTVPQPSKATSGRLLLPPRLSNRLRIF